MRFTTPRKTLLCACIACLALTQSATVIQLEANLDASQETMTSSSTATGTATMWYDTSTNTFDLTVKVMDMANAITGSHVHEGASGTAGGVVTGLGDEVSYMRNGANLTATFSGLTYGGDASALLRGDAYVNIHSAAFPGGEIRGQLMASPIKLWANLSPAQETSSVESAAYGAAQMWINPATGKFHLVLFAYNFTNTLVGSHIHEGAAGSDGGVVNSLGAAAAYNMNGNTYSQVWNDVTYDGNLATLLNGGSYINLHSDAFGSGEIRGQLWVSDPTTGSRLSNVSSRGMVGSGDASLVVGFVIEGVEPLQVVVTGRGPVLTDFGVSGALADPVLYVHDRWGNQLYWNDNKADATYPEALMDSGFLPTMDAEAAALVLLPPGPHTMTVKGVDGTTGIALAEAFHVSN